MDLKAWNLWYLGFPDQAAATVADSLAWAPEIGHPNTTCMVLCYGVALVHVWLRDAGRVEAAARDVLRLADEMSLALWHAWARVQLGWAVFVTRVRNEQHHVCRLEIRYHQLV